MRRKEENASAKEGEQESGFRNPLSPSLLRRGNSDLTYTEETWASPILKLKMIDRGSFVSEWLGGQHYNKTISISFPKGNMSRKRTKSVIKQRRPHKVATDLSSIF